MKQIVLLMCAVLCVAMPAIARAQEPLRADGQADRLRQILQRNSPVLRDVYANVATPYRIKNRSPVGYYLGNGDATVTARDAKGKWTFIVSPLAYYHGDTAKDRSTYAGWSGQIDIRIPQLAECHDYQVTLDLYRGELRGRFTGQTGSVVMRTHVVRDTNFLVTSVENVGPSAVSVSVELSTGKPYNEYSASAGGAKGDVAYVTRNGRESDNPLSVVCYTSLGSRIVGAESAARRDADKPYQARLDPVTVQPGNVVHVVSSYEVSAVFPPDYITPGIQAMVANQTSDAVTPVLKRLGGQTPATAAVMIEANARWWRDFWGRSHIDIPAEPLVEKQWYGRLYLAGCMCREGSFPPGLFAWIDNEAPAWGSDYHWNFNTAFVFNGLSAANHPELVKPYCDLVIAQLPLARQYAAEKGEPGVHFGTGTTPYGWMHKGDYEMRHNAADAAMNVITWYRLTRDETWMREKLYPFLKEIAANSAGFLIRDGQRYVVSSCVAELDCNHRINATQAIAFTSRVFRTLIELSKELNVDAELRPAWQETLDRMSPVTVALFGEVLGQNQVPTIIVPENSGKREAVKIDTEILKVLKSLNETFAETTKAWSAKNFEAVRAEYGKVLAMTNAPSHYKSYAHLRIAQSYAAEKNTAAAKAEYEKIKANAEYPEVHRYEAEECVKEIDRVAQGLPARDVSASRTKVPPIAAFAVEYFVAPTGNDANPGTREKPFASLEKARDAIRALKAKGGLPGPACVRLMPGEYPMKKTLELTAADSGTAESPIIYRADKKGAAVLYGGTRLSGFAPVTDPAVLKRLPDEAKGKVFQCDLKKLSINDYSPLTERGYGVKAPASTLELFFNGTPLTLARWPNSGFVNGGKVLEPGSVKEGNLSIFEYLDDRHSRWTAAEDGWLFGY
ncbi:MAG: hypothetical protein NTU53_00725, partial [Planctomycetota bacterium]|nr:hypothetical protein [Planctomycetota bacterium]